MTNFRYPTTRSLMLPPSPEGVVPMAGIPTSASSRESPSAGVRRSSVMRSDVPGRVYRVGEYYPAAAATRRGIPAPGDFIGDARRFALDVLRVVEAGADAVEVWKRILTGGRVLRRNAPEMSEEM